MPSPPYFLFPELYLTNFKTLFFFLKTEIKRKKTKRDNQQSILQQVKDAMVGKLKPVRCGNIFKKYLIKKPKPDLTPYIL